MITSASLRNDAPNPPAQQQLTELAARANRAHRAFADTMRAGLSHALEAGQLLINAKALCSHGSWLGWLADNFEGSKRSAQTYMRVAEHWPEIEAKSADSAHLSLDAAVELLTPARPISLVEQNRIAEQRFHRMRARGAVLDWAEHQGIEHVQRFVWLGKLDHEQLADLWESIGQVNRTILGPLVECIGKVPDPVTLALALHRIGRDDDDLDVTVEVPELSAAVELSTILENGCLAEIVPSVAHPDYFYLAVYEDMHADNASVVFTRRPVRLTADNFASITGAMFQSHPAMGWHSQPASGHDPLYITMPGKTQPAGRAFR